MDQDRGSTVYRTGPSIYLETELKKRSLSYMGVTQFLKPAAHKTLLPEQNIDPEYKKLRLQVFIGIFVGYAGYYLIRKSFSMVMPDLIERGYTKADLGVALSSISIAYGISKFVMGTVSDRSNARIFLSIGLVLSAVTMIVM